MFFEFMLFHNYHSWHSNLNYQVFAFRCISIWHMHWYQLDHIAYKIHPEEVPHITSTLSEDNFFCQQKEWYMEGILNKFHLLGLCPEICKRWDRTTYRHFELSNSLHIANRFHPSTPWISHYTRQLHTPIHDLKAWYNPNINCKCHQLGLSLFPCRRYLLCIRNHRVGASYMEHSHPPFIFFHLGI